MAKSVGISTRRLPGRAALAQMGAIVSCLAVLGIATPSTAAVDWSREGAFPGAEVAASEWSDVTRAGSLFRCTQLQAPGVPEYLRFRLWQRWLDGMERALEPTIAVTADGLCVDAADGSPALICLGQFFSGEPLDVALVAEDAGVRVLGTLIPFPLEAAGVGGSCRLVLRMVDPGGTAFSARAEGFAPGERLETESRSGKERRPRTAAADDDGALTVYLQPQAGGKRGGTAAFSVAGDRCSATIDYDWGRSMRRR